MNEGEQEKFGAFTNLSSGQQFGTFSNKTYVQNSNV